MDVLIGLFWTSVGRMNTESCNICIGLSAGIEELINIYGYSKN